MKLLTHNLLTSNIIKGVTMGYPLKITAKEVDVAEVDFNPDFIKRMLQRLDWKVASEAAKVLLPSEQDLPSELPADFDSNEEFLRRAHHVLLEIEVKEGELICPQTGRIFTINKGIPNMLLRDDEL